MNYWLTVLSLCLVFVYANGLDCKNCFGDDWADCDDNSIDKQCPESATHCYLGYSLHTNGSDTPKIGVARGCGETDEATTCQMINQTLQSTLGRYMTKCHVSSFCDSDLCNTAEPPVNSSGSLTCKSCQGDDWNDCDNDAENETCTGDATRCFVGYGLQTDGNSVPKFGVARGCGPSDTNAICKMVNESLMVNDKKFLTFCKVSSFCDTDLCNTATPTPVAPELKCRSCMSTSSWSDCEEEEKVCPLGNIHCFEGFSQVTKSSSTPSKLGFAKGCTYCPSAKVGCQVYNETLKMEPDGYFISSGCNMNCCQGDNCNTGKPTPPEPTMSTTPSAGPLSKGNGALTVVAITLVWLFMAVGH